MQMSTGILELEVSDEFDTSLSRRLNTQPHTFASEPLL